MKRSKHNLNHYNLFTGDMGLLMPVGLTEVLPGDTFQHSTSLMVRLSPMAAPVMHPIEVRLHHWYVPNRILWDGWEDFITGGPDGDNTSEIPTVARATTQPFNVLDYLGVPAIDGLEVNALPLWAYNRIFNEYYRDQDLMDERGENTQTLQNICWEKDNFTSARPWETKGPEITLPIGSSAPIQADGTLIFENDSDQENTALRWTGAAQGEIWAEAGSAGQPGTLSYVSGLQADLSQANPVAVNEVRRAFALQRYQEARAKYGSRYTEYLRFLGIRSSDSRLQRPEYLGGGKQTVSISEVLQTAPENPAVQNDTDYGVGDLYGHGIAAMRSNAYRRFFEEHGYVVSLMSVRPKAMYINGVDRHWLKKDKEDYWQKELQFIGQQAMLNGEVYVDGSPEDRDTFGFQDRYIEYKRQLSRVSGEFRELLNYWHLGREFTERPVLNESFVRCIPSKRIFNEQTQNSLWCAAQHKLIARRMVAKSNQSRII